MVHVWKCHERTQFSEWELKTLKCYPKVGMGVRGVGGGAHKSTNVQRNINHELHNFASP